MNGFSSDEFVRKSLTGIFLTGVGVGVSVRVDSSQWTWWEDWNRIVSVGMVIPGCIIRMSPTTSAVLLMEMRVESLIIFTVVMLAGFREWVLIL